MLNLKVNAAKDLFFDRSRVIAAMDRASRQSLSRAGAMVMREARSLTKRVGRKRSRKRDGRGRLSGGVEQIHSLPGEPPRMQTGLLRNNIFFAADIGRQSVVIGPALLNARDTSAPSTLEYGGTATVRRTVMRRGRRVTESRVVRIQPRPYMAPSLRNIAPKLPEQFRNSVRV